MERIRHLLLDNSVDLLQQLHQVCIAAVIMDGRNQLAQEQIHLPPGHLATLQGLAGGVGFGLAQFRVVDAQLFGFVGHAARVARPGRQVKRPPDHGSGGPGLARGAGVGRLGWELS